MVSWRDSLLLSPWGLAIRNLTGTPGKYDTSTVTREDCFASSWHFEVWSLVEQQRKKQRSEFFAGVALLAALLQRYASTQFPETSRAKTNGRWLGTCQTGVIFFWRFSRLLNLISNSDFSTLFFCVQIRGGDGVFSPRTQCMRSCFFFVFSFPFLTMKYLTA